MPDNIVNTGIVNVGSGTVNIGDGNKIGGEDTEDAKE